MQTLLKDIIFTLEAYEPSYLSRITPRYELILPESLLTELALERRPLGLAEGAPFLSLIIQFH